MPAKQMLPGRRPSTVRTRGRLRPAANAKRPAGRGPLAQVRRTQQQLRKAWDRPLTAYYLIFGSSLLITVLGLVMVYSASMIKALQLGLGDAYFFKKQFIAALIGAGLLLAASRMPVKLHRALSYP
ncbi:FtsW/RodA/SpoVE family cell cycle protein, partial [Streptomyces xanthophaeus]